MPLVESLLVNAHQDTQLLIKNDDRGDKFERPRDVEFSLKTTDKAHAKTVCSFINDNQYGLAQISTKTKDTYWILITINMPTTQHVLCSVSALMVCIAALFKVEYDGWGCVLQTAAAASKTP